MTNQEITNLLAYACSKGFEIDQKEPFEEVIMSAIDFLEKKGYSIEEAKA